MHTRAMLHVSPEGWVATLVVIAGLLALDLVVLGARGRAVSLREAAGWSLFYIGVALLFGLAFSLLAGWSFGAQYFTGYVLEKSLSLDNLFVFVIIIGAFAVPPAEQPKAITLGIALALALRAALIAVGAALLSAFSVTFLVFGLVLIATAVQLFRHRDADPDVGENPLVGAARRFLPLTSGYDSGRIVSRRDGRLAFTPLFLALIAIGSADVIFAFDSIPAVFGVTHHAYIVFAANAFALLGLRPLFFLVSGLLDRLLYMSSGLAAILAFVGIKLVLEFAHSQNDSIPEISTAVSLGVIVAVLGVTVAASLIASRRQPAARAHAGTLREHPREHPRGSHEMRSVPHSPGAGRKGESERMQTPDTREKR